MRRILLSTADRRPTAAPAFAQDRGYGDGGSSQDNIHYAWADVLRVDPVYDVVQVEPPAGALLRPPGRAGHGRQHRRHPARRGGRRRPGHQVGHGRGNVAATIGGAVVGGAIGNNASSGQQVENQTRCEQVGQVGEQRRIAGYDVEYRYRGDVYVSRLNYDPGERLRIRISVVPAD